MAFVLLATRHSLPSIRSHCSRHEPLDRGAPIRAELEPELAAPPQHVVDGLRPFVPHQVADFGAGEIATETRAEIGETRRAVEHDLDPGAVGRDEPARMAVGEE